MKTRVLLLVAGLSLAAGYLLGTRFAAAPDEPFRAHLARVQPASPAAPGYSPARPSQPSPDFADLQNQPTVFDTLYLAYQIAAGADLDRLAAYGAEALSYEDPLFRHHVAAIFVERMTALDVSAALDFAEALPDGESRRSLITSVLASWVRRDSASALAYLESISDPLLRQMVAAAFSRDNTLDGDVSQLVHSLASAPSGADAIFFGGVGFNPALPLERESSEIMQRVRENPQQTMDELLASPPSDPGDTVLMTALGMLASENPELALDYLEQHPERLRSGAGMVMRSMAKSRPDLAPALADRHLENGGESAELGAVLSGWLESDREAALAYYADMPPNLQSQIGMTLGLEYVRQEPEAGLAWMLQQDLPPHALGIPFRRQGADVSAAAENLLPQLPPGEQRSRLITAMAVGKSETDPTAAIDWLQQHRDDPGYAPAYAESLARWAHQDPAGAAAQINRDPPAADAPYNVYDSMAYSWGRTDPDAVEAWANQLTAPGAREKVLGSLVLVVAQHDESRAREMYFSLPPGDDRYRTGAQLALQEVGQDPTRLRAMMEELELPERVIDSYLTVLGQ